MEFVTILPSTELAPVWIAAEWQRHQSRQFFKHEFFDVLEQYDI